MQRVRVLALVVAAIGAASGCDQGNVCALVDYELPPPVSVVIRDQAGTPAALGSVVTFGGAGRQLRDSTLGDTLTVSGGAYNTVYGVLVTRPFYTAATFDSLSVHATYDDCHKPKTFDLPVTLNATLTLLPNAPPVRSLYLVSNTRSTTLDRGGQDSLKVEPWLDANASVSRAVIWHLSGDTASVSFNPATGVASFRCRPTGTPGEPDRSALQLAKPWRRGKPQQLNRGFSPLIKRDFRGLTSWGNCSLRNECSSPKALPAKIAVTNPRLFPRSSSCHCPF